MSTREYSSQSVGSTTEESSKLKEYSKELIDSVQKQYDYSIKVVNNANQLRKAGIDGVARTQSEWLPELRELVKKTEECLKSMIVCGETIQSCVVASKMKLDTSEADARVAKLDEALNELRTSKIEEWMVSSEFPIDMDTVNGSLIDFVDTQGITVTREKMSKLIAQARAAIGSMEEQVESINDSKRKIEDEMLDMLHPLEMQSKGKSTSPAEVLAGVLSKLEQSTQGQDQVLKILSNGSFSLAALNEFLVNGPGSFSTEHQDIGHFETKLHEFVRNCKQANLIADNTNSEKAQSIESLVESTMLCLKGGLKSIFVSYDEISKTIKEVQNMRESLAEKILTKSQSVLEDSKDKAVAAQNTQAKVISNVQEMNRYSLELEKLDRVYRKFVSSKPKLQMEIERRWKALADIEALAKRQQDELSALLQEESNLRKEFRDTYDTILPHGFCPALTLEMPPTTFQYVLINPEDAQLLQDCTNKLHAAKQEPVD